MSPCIKEQKTLTRQGIDFLGIGAQKAATTWIYEWLIQQTDTTRFSPAGSSVGSRSRGDYLSSIRKWCANIPREQFLVLLFDDIVQDPGSVLGALCHHIEVDANWFAGEPFFDLAKPVFAGPGHDLPEQLLDFLKIIYEPMIKPLSDFIGRDLSRWLEWDGKRESEIAQLY